MNMPIIYCCEIAKSSRFKVFPFYLKFQFMLADTRAVSLSIRAVLLSRRWAGINFQVQFKSLACDWEKILKQAKYLTYKFGQFVHKPRVPCKVRPLGAYYCDWPLCILHEVPECLNNYIRIIFVQISVFVCICPCVFVRTCCTLNAANMCANTSKLTLIITCFERAFPMMDLFPIQ